MKIEPLQDTRPPIEVTLMGPFALKKEGRLCLAETDAATEEARQLLALLLLGHAVLRDKRDAPYYREIIAEDVGQNQFIRREWLSGCLYPEKTATAREVNDRIRYLLTKVLNPIVHILPEMDEQRERRNRLGIHLDLDHCLLDIEQGGADRPLLEGWNYGWLQSPEIREIADRIDLGFLREQQRAMQKYVSLWQEAQRNRDYEAMGRYRADALDPLEKAACRALHNPRMLAPFRVFISSWPLLEEEPLLGSCRSKLPERLQAAGISVGLSQERTETVVPERFVATKRETEKTGLEIRIDTDFERYSVHDLAVFLARAQELCGPSVVIRVLSVKPGSVLIRLSVPRESARQIQQAIEAGAFQDVAAMTAQIVEGPDSPVSTLQQVRERLLALSAFDLNLLMRTVGAPVTATEKLSTENRVETLLQWAQTQEGGLQEIEDVGYRLVKNFGQPHPIAIALRALAERKDVGVSALSVWWDQVKRGLNDLGVALQAEIFSDGPGWIVPFPGVNQPGLQLTSGLETKGVGPEEKSPVLMIAKGVGNGEVTVIEESVTVTLFGASTADLPYVLLMPNDHPEKVRVSQTVATDPPGGLEAKFDNVRPGKYLIAIEPVVYSDVAIANRISPALLRQIEGLLGQSEEELLQEMGHRLLSGSLSAVETSPGETEEEGKIYLTRLLPSLQKALCDDARIQALLSHPADALTAGNVAYLAYRIGSLSADVDPEMLAAYLVKSGLKGLCPES